MIKTAPFIATTGDEDFKKFIEQQFKIDMIHPIFGEKSVQTLFVDWRGKDMLTWHRFTNSENDVLGFYPTHYEITKSGTPSTKLPLPLTLNDFINDLHRLGIQLFWSMWIDENFEPKQYLHADEIEKYYRDLLNKMGKSHELL